MKDGVPKVSICILCYNAKKTITSAVRTAVHQDYQNTEIIVVDDASTDNSLEILTKLQRRYKITLVKHKTNKGRGGARKSAVISATGEFIVFFDDDDNSSLDRVTVQLHTIINYEKKLNTKNIACYASSERQYQNGYRVNGQAIGSTQETPPHGPDMAKYLLSYHRRKDWFYGAGTPTSALMIRKSLVQSVGGFDPSLRYVEDVDLAIRLALADTYFLGSPAKLLTRNMTQSEDKSAKNNLIAERKIVMKYATFLRKNKIFHHAYHWPELRYWHFKRNYLMFLIKLFILAFYNPIITFKHLGATGPKRLQHESKMKM